MNFLNKNESLLSFKEEDIRISFVECLLMSSTYALIYYILFSSVAYFLFKEYNNVDWKNTKNQLYQSVKSLLIISPFTALIQYGLYNGLVGKIYFDITERSIFHLIFSIIFCYVVTDSALYWLHRLFHVPFFYYNFHYIHQQYHPITSFSASAVDAFDLFLSGVLPVYIPVFICSTHIGVFLFFSWFSLMWSIYLHTPNSPHSLIKFIYDSNDHNIHHKTGRHNFGIYTKIWDVSQNTYLSQVPLFK